MGDSRSRSATRPRELGGKQVPLAARIAIVALLRCMIVLLAAAPTPPTGLT